MNTSSQKFVNTGLAIYLLLIVLFGIPDGLFGKKEPFIGRDRFNRQISEGIIDNGDTVSVTYYAFHPFQFDTTKMAINKIAGRLTKQEIDIFENFSEVYKFADTGPQEELYVVQGSQIDSIFTMVYSVLKKLSYLQMPIKNSVIIMKRVEKRASGPNGMIMKQ